MFDVDWIESAVNELAGYWIDADAVMRAMITDATAEIDRRLTDDPLGVGESRNQGMRFDFVYPLAVDYQVDVAAQRATVLHIRVYLRRQR